MTKLIVFLAFVLPTARMFADTISVSGPLANPTVGETFSIDVDVSGIRDLYAFQFDLSFDPTLLSAVSVAEGAFLPEGGTTFFVPGTIDNIGGTVAATADTLIAAVPGVTGDGIVVQFQFTALAPGTSALSFSNEILLDSLLNDTTADTVFQNGSVTIGEVSSVPEPSTLLTILVGLTWAILFRSKFSRSSR